MKNECSFNSSKSPEDPLPSALCCYRLLHPELSPRWSLCEKGPQQPPWLNQQTPPAGKRPLGSRGHTRLHATFYRRRSSAGVESDPPHPWAGSSSSTLLWMVRRSRAGCWCAAYFHLLQTTHWLSLVYGSNRQIPAHGQH